MFCSVFSHKCLNKNLVTLHMFACFDFVFRPRCCALLDALLMGWLHTKLPQCVIAFAQRNIHFGCLSDTM